MYIEELKRDKQAVVVWSEDAKMNRLFFILLFLAFLSSINFVYAHGEIISNYYSGMHHRTFYHGNNMMSGEMSGGMVGGSYLSMMRMHYSRYNHKYTMTNRGVMNEGDMINRRKFGGMMSGMNGMMGGMI